ncbi:MAG: T9SS type A sorting domain-containing protein [Flavobacteriales bacterium]|nr:T9SS type A sorting domain-containing protein [Flavobacteriales bacterium]
MTDTANDPLHTAGAIYLIKTDPAGSVLWSKAISVGSGAFGDLTVDAAGDLFVVCRSTTGMDQFAHLFKLSGTDGSDIFHHTSTEGVAPAHMGLDGAGNILVQGTAQGPFTLGGGPVCPYNNVLGGNGESLFIGKFDPNGSALWYHVPDQASGIWYDNELAVASDGRSCAIADGALRFGNDTVCDGAGAQRAMYALDADGAVLWFRTLNLTGAIQIGDMEYHQDQVLVAGYNVSVVDLVDTVIVTPPDDHDLLLMRFDADGALNGLLVGPTLGIGNMSIEGMVAGIAVDDDGLPAVCGAFVLTDPVFGPDTLSGGYATSYVARLGAEPLPTAVSLMSDPRRLRLYPDPADQHINMDSDLTSTEVFVHDVSGELMWSGFARSFPHRLDVSSWPSGLYCVRAIGDQRTASARFIVQH